MDTCITYDLIKLLLANPPSIEPRPNFFNLKTLRTHFARPQSSVNGWAGATMSPEMYALIDNTPFCIRIATKTTTPDYLDKLDAQGVSIPYTHEEKSKNQRRILAPKELLQDVEKYTLRGV
jgi:hypothetical protein